MEPVQSLFFAGGLTPAELGFDRGSGNLFDQLLDRGQALWHAPPRTERLTALLPGPLRQKLATTPFYAMGLHTANRPSAFIYADAGEDGGLDEAGYNAFKRICVTLAQALERVTD
jgi:hypothetical protein